MHLTRIVLLNLLCLSTAWSQTGEPCQAALERAEDLYDAGDLDEVIKLLDECRPEQLPEARHRLRAYKLLALVQLKIGKAGEAEEAVSSLLDVRPKFEPDPVQDPPEFVELVHQLKSQRAKKSNKKWYWIGGGGLVAGAVAAYLIFKEDELADLPTPPGPPGR